MQYSSIADIYAANDAIRTGFRSLVGTITPDEASALPEGEAWTIEQIVEHVALVNTGMTRICTRLLGKSKEDGLTAGEVVVSDEFMSRSADIARIKVEAPDMVKPQGGKTIAESLAGIDAVQQQLDEIRPMFEAFDGTTHKFPHPFFGDLSATEWLILLGGHESRHTAQIKKILQKLRPA